MNLTSHLLVSVILPVHNQADHIQRIIQEYEDVLNSLPCDYELLLIVNNCRDQSAEVCVGLSKQNPKIRVQVTEAGGWGLAVNLGIQLSKGNLICYTNSARTDPKDLQLILLYAITNPNCVIKANRKIRESFVRRLGSLLYNLEARTLFDLNIWDINGTPKVFNREHGELLSLTRKDDLIDLEFNIICQRAHYKILEIPIFSIRRHGGRSTTRLSSAFRMYLGAIQLWCQR